MQLVPNVPDPFRAQIIDSRCESAPMADLAEATGGTYFHNNNDLDAGFKSLTGAPEYLYVLELALDNVKPDGTYHRLKVKVDRGDLQVEGRSGYFMPKAVKTKK